MKIIATSAIKQIKLAVLFKLPLDVVATSFVVLMALFVASSSIVIFVTVVSSVVATVVTRIRI